MSTDNKRGPSALNFNLFAMRLQVKDFINQCVDELGIDEYYMTKFDSAELDLLVANDEIAFRTWEIQEGRTHHSMSIYVKGESNQYQIEVNSIMHDV